MTALGNARQYAGGFAFRRPMKMVETTAGLRDLIPLCTTVSELLRQEPEGLCDEHSPATDAVLAKLQDVTDADAEVSGPDGTTGLHPGLWWRVSKAGKSLQGPGPAANVTASRPAAGGTSRHTLDGGWGGWFRRAWFRNLPEPVPEPLLFVGLSAQKHRFIILVPEVPIGAARFLITTEVPLNTAKNFVQFHRNFRNFAESARLRAESWFRKVSDVRNKCCVSSPQPTTLPDQGVDGPAGPAPGCRPGWRSTATSFERRISAHSFPARQQQRPRCVNTEAAG